MAKPVLSVIMPAYNAQDTIAAAVESVLQQTCSDFEFIIINDSSSDGTAEVIGDFNDPRLLMVHNKKNLGVAASLSLGAARARGEWLARMDADDLSRPARFEKQIAWLHEHPEVGLLGTAYELMDTQSRLFDSRVRPGDDEYLQRELLKLNPICHGSVMMRRSLVQALGGYDGRFPHAEDYDLWLRCAEVTRLALLSDKLYIWRVTPRSVTQSARDVQESSAARARRLAWERRLSGRDRYGRAMNLRPRRRAEKLLLAEHCVIWGREALRARRIGRAARLFARAASLDAGSRRLKEALVRAPKAITRAVANAVVRGDVVRRGEEP